MLRSIDLNELKPSDTLIVLGSGSKVWAYEFCGLSGIYVQGGLDVNSDGWFKFNELRRMNAMITEHLCGLDSPMCAAQYNFLRKQIGLSNAELCFLLSLDLETFESWVSGDGFAPGSDLSEVKSLALDVVRKKLSKAQMRERVAIKQRAA